MRQALPLACGVKIWPYLPFYLTHELIQNHIPIFSCFFMYLFEYLMFHVCKVHLKKKKYYIVFGFTFPIFSLKQNLFGSIKKVSLSQFCILVNYVFEFDTPATSCVCFLLQKCAKPTHCKKQTDCNVAELMSKTVPSQQKFALCSPNKLQTCAERV